MNTAILNREFQHPSDGWYQIEALGDHPNARAGLVQIIDDTACRSMVNRFQAESAAPDFPGLLIDREHFKLNPDRETTAYGWLLQLQNRADGLYGKIRWSHTGQQAVDGGEYRFFSTEYDARDVVVLNPGESPRRVRPMRLDGLTLTNAHNNKGQKPITNRGVASDPLPKAKQMNTVCTLLGLSADASEESVHAAVSGLITNRQSHQSEIEQITQRAARAEEKVRELEASQIQTDLETYKNRFDARQRDFMKSLLVTNRAATLEFLKSQPEIKAATAPARLHQRANAQPVDAPAGGAGADPVALSATRSQAIEQYKISNRCSFQQAHDAVRRKNPELFGLTRLH